MVVPWQAAIKQHSVQSSGKALPFCGHCKPSQCWLLTPLLLPTFHINTTHCWQSTHAASHHAYRSVLQHPSSLVIIAPALLQGRPTLCLPLRRQPLQPVHMGYETATKGNISPPEHHWLHPSRQPRADICAPRLSCAAPLAAKCLFCCRPGDN